MRNLDELVVNYCQNKEIVDKYTKVVKPLADELKQVILEDGRVGEEIKANNFQVKVSVSETEEIDEVGLIAELKAQGADYLVKTKEYIDKDDLAKAIRGQEIDIAVIKPYIKLKEVPKLTYKVYKGAK